MTDRHQFLTSSLGYAVSQVVGLAVSLLSFPLLTRMLSVAEYGVLGLCSTTLLFGSALCKFGLQNAVVRFYYDYRRKDELHRFYATFWWGGAAASLLVSLLLLPLILLVAPAGYRLSFLSVVLVAFGMSLLSVISNFLRAEERNGASAAVNATFRILSTAGGIALLYFLKAGITGIFLAQFAVILLIGFKYIREYLQRSYLHLGDFCRPLFREALSFGAPLIAFEVSTIGLAFSDRYLISHLCGAEQLGIYTAGYTLCFYIADTVRQPLGMSIVPIYLRVYADQGEEATAALIRDIIGYVFLVIAPVFAGSCAVREDLLVLLASGKYSASAAIVPWVLGSTLLYACQPLLAAGFTIRKQTLLLSKVIVGGAATNVAMNLVLLPRFGIIAAAWSTAFAYAAVLAVLAVASARTFPLYLPYRRIATYGLASVAMYGAVVSCSALDLAARIVVGVIVYTALIGVCDRKVASDVTGFLLSRGKALRCALG